MIAIGCVTVCDVMIAIGLSQLMVLLLSEYHSWWCYDCYRGVTVYGVMIAIGVSQLMVLLLLGCHS